MSRKAFTITTLWSDSVTIKSVATGKTYVVHYDGRIKPEVGDTITVIIDDNNDKWKTIINERTGDAATVSRVY